MILTNHDFYYPFKKMVHLGCSVQVINIKPTEHDGGGGISLLLLFS